LCNAVPSADAAPPLIALGASLKIEGPKGEKKIELENFFAGPSLSVLQPGEIVTEIAIPALTARSSGAYMKQMLRAEMDLAVVGVAAYVILSAKKDRCVDVKIALGAVAPTPLRAKKAEEALKGKKLDGGAIETASAIAAEESKPIDDIRSSAEYRKEIVRVLTKRAILQAMQRA
jgi:carbon-monoxide dehydrogenase medium subunit